jgi:crossover junction endodeoxyribonuclease RusA
VIVVELGPPPTKPLSLNEERRMHWAAKGRRLTPWKEAAWAAAIQSDLRRVLGGAPCRVTVEIPVPDNRRRDPANYYPVSKAIVDGLVAAKVWPDDTPEYVEVTEPVLVRDWMARIRLELRQETRVVPVQEFCCGCSGAIYPGETATATPGLFDDEPAWLCPRCIAWREKVR